MKNDKTNDLYVFLIEQGVPEVSLPRLMEVSPAHLVPIIDGYGNKDKTERFYLCICNSGHEACCGGWEWAYSGWSIRIKGKEAIFFKGEWKFNLSQLPISQDILFIVSKRTKVNECAKCRADVVCVSKDKQKLERSVKKPETNRKNT